MDINGDFRLKACPNAIRLRDHAIAVGKISASAIAAIAVFGAFAPTVNSPRPNHIWDARFGPYSA
jgi:hypothetical protein